MWNEDYKEMLCALSDASAEFILVGAYALAAHGFPRATMDLDLWVRPSASNARKVCEALRKFGAPKSLISEADFEKDDQVVQIGVAPRRVDLITSVSGLTYEEASRRAIVRDLGGVRVPILSAEDFIRNKLASGRPKDIEDAKLLQEYFPER